MKLGIYISTKQDGSMKWIDGSFDEIKNTRFAFLKKCKINPDNTMLIRVVYEGDDYCRYSKVDNSNLGDGIVRQKVITADALATDRTNVALFLPLADCIGAVICDENKGVMMVSHLGRHSLEQDGGKKSVNYLIENYDVNLEDIKVWLSPAAGAEAYPMYKFNDRSLHDVAREQFESAGILSKNIQASPIDTTKDSDYYSHSNFLKGKLDDSGRFALAAVMR